MIIMEMIICAFIFIPTGIYVGWHLCQWEISRLEHGKRLKAVRANRKFRR